MTFSAGFCANGLAPVQLNMILEAIGLAPMLITVGLVAVERLCLESHYARILLFQEVY